MIYSSPSRTALCPMYSRLFSELFKHLEILHRMIREINLYILQKRSRQHCLHYTIKLS
jgi:hypothetical protein